MSSAKETSFVWTLITVFMVIWLSIDIYNSIFHGETLMLRQSRVLTIEDSSIFFVLTVTVKLVVYSYCCVYLYKLFAPKQHKQGK